MKYLAALSQRLSRALSHSLYSGGVAEAEPALLRSCLCTEATLLSPAFQLWVSELKGIPQQLHRKAWEWCFISQALHERGMLKEGKRGLGFAVGQEPLSALYAKYGASVLATDLFVDAAHAKGWVETAQHADGYAAINQRGICDEAILKQRVAFEFADMNDIDPKFHTAFDFVWSSCALEHLGSLKNGEQFILNAMHCLKPGGVAVHTTEFNVSSRVVSQPTLETGDTVLYRRCDIEKIVALLRTAGHAISVDWNQGAGIADGHVDLPPYKQDIHLKLQIERYTVTSIGLIITKGV